MIINSKKAKTILILILLVIIAIGAFIFVFGINRIEKILITALLFAWLIYGILSGEIFKDPPTPKATHTEYDAYLHEIYFAVAEIADLVNLKMPLSDWNLHPLHGAKAISNEGKLIFRFHAYCKPLMSIDIRKIHKLLQLTINRRYQANQSGVRTKKNQSIKVARVFTEGDILEIQVYCE